MSGPAGLRLVVAQTAPALADPETNARTLEDAARAERGRADLVVFPELALTGYGLGQRARELGVDLEGGPPLALPADGPAVAYGLVERGADHLTYNSAVVQRGEALVHVHRKRYLPTYGTFDEGRVFAPARVPPGPFQLAPGWRAGLLVCEDLWHPALGYLLAVQGIDLLLVLAAAPGRGGTDAQGAFRSAEPWELLVRATAVQYQVYVALANRAGCEDGVTFAGGSLVVGPDGSVLARAAWAEPDRLGVALEKDAVARARHPYAHLRDDDPAFTLRGLRRALRDR